MPVRPVLVAVTAERARALQAALGDDAARVRFIDMRELGRNPARVIPAWREFVTEHAEDERAGQGRRRTGLARAQRSRAGGVRSSRVAVEHGLRLRAAVEPAVPV